jgi:hypothetical protein
MCWSGYMWCALEIFLLCRCMSTVCCGQLTLSIWLFKCHISAASWITIHFNIVITHHFKQWTVLLSVHVTCTPHLAVTLPQWESSFNCDKLVYCYPLVYLASVAHLALFFISCVSTKKISYNKLRTFTLCRRKWFSFFSQPVVLLSMRRTGNCLRHLHFSPRLAVPFLSSQLPATFVPDLLQFGHS